MKKILTSLFLCGMITTISSGHTSVNSGRLACRFTYHVYCGSEYIGASTAIAETCARARELAKIGVSQAPC